MSGVRYQAGMRVEDVYPPQPKGHCLCGCGQRLPPRRRKWASDACIAVAVRRYEILKGDAHVIRMALRERDLAVCVRCFRQCEVLACRWPRDPGHYLNGSLTGVYYRKALIPWEAHHVVPVVEGGGGCDLEGYETLCVDCHRAETAELARRRALGRRGQMELEVR